MWRKIPNVEIYGFSGKLGSGKDFIAKVFMNMMPPIPTIVTSLADELKLQSIVYDDLEREKVFGHKDEKTRLALQRRGTELGRNVYGEDIWLKFMYEKIIMYASRGIKRVVITDIRFPNEVEFVKDVGGSVFRILSKDRHMQKLSEEGGSAEISMHSSETALDDYPLIKFSYVINNNFNDDVYVQLREIVLKIRVNNNLVIFCDLDDTVCSCNKNYDDVYRRVREMMWEHLSPKYQKIDMLALERGDDNYRHTPFSRTRYADSMVKMVKQFSEYYFEGTNVDALAKEAYTMGMSVFDYDFPALEDACEVIREMQKLGRVVLYTIGDRVDQVRKITRLGLADLDFEIYDYKDETLFRSLMSKYPSKRYIMIGDSYHRDILPAMNSGVDLAIHIKNSSLLREKGYICVKHLRDALIHIA